MENKKSFIKLILSFVVVLSLSVFVFALSKQRVKAEPIPSRYFQHFNSGFSGLGSTDYNFVTGYDLEDESWTGQGGFYETTDYGYEIITLGGDMPFVYTILCSVNALGATYTNGQIDSNFTLNNVAGGLIFECGFVGVEIDNNTNLDSINLPFKFDSELTAPQDVNVGLLDIQDLNIFSEGFLYFVIRFDIDFFSRCIDYDSSYAPYFLFCDFKINPSAEINFIDGYETGKREGLAVGEQTGYTNGYYTGYNDGLLHSSADYGISDLLFAIYDVPIQVLSNVFSFTIFGTTMWSILLTLLVLLVALFIIKRLIK